MEIPPGFDVEKLLKRRNTGLNKISHNEFVRRPDKFVLKVNKAIYGTPQAGRYWNEDITKFLISLGYVQFAKDHCIFKKSFPDGEVSIIALYVDDLITVGPYDDRTESLKSRLGEKYQVKCMGVIKEFLGISFERDRESLSMSLEKYIDKMLMRFNMTECKPSENPGTAKANLTRA
jgi:hypothetical protein